MNLNSIGLITTTVIGRRLDAYVATLVDLDTLEPLSASEAALSKAS